MLSLALDISEVLRNLDILERELKAAMEKGTDAADSRMIDHAQADHGADAHSRDRFVTRSGNLMDEIETIPAVVLSDRVLGGIAAIPDYAKHVEFGHDIVRRGGTTKTGKPTFGGIVGTARAYPFFGPIRKDERLHRDIISDYAFYLRQAMRRSPKR